MQVELSHRTQHGTALVFALLILLIMTVLGVAALSNTQMQERMAGNVSLQSLAFEASSAGIGDALEFGMNQFFGDPSDATETNLGEPRCTTSQIDDWRDAGGNSEPRFDTKKTLQLQDKSFQTATIEYQLRAECFQDPGLDPTVAPAEGYVTSEGRVRSGTEVLSAREVEVRVDDFRSDGRSALRIEGGDESAVTVTFSAPNSNQLFVDGSNGPAISTRTQKNAEEVQKSIKERRLANYDGGIASSSYDPPFGTPRGMARFVLEVRAFMEYHGVDETPTEATTTETTDADGTTKPAECDAGEIDEANTVYGFNDADSDLDPLVVPNLTYVDGNAASKEDFDGVTYITGNLTMGGNPTGRGIVIVEGDVHWHGKADFQGLVIGLNGNFDFDGGGSGVSDGSVYVAKLDLDADPELVAAYDALDLDPATNDWADVIDAIYNWDGTVYDDLEFGDSNVNLDGGGGHRITYDCGLIDQQRMTLGACGKVSLEDNFPEPADENAAGIVPPGLAKKAIFDGLADPWWEQECNKPGAGGSIQAIRSWRENLGWRELVDDSA